MTASLATAIAAPYLCPTNMTLALLSGILFLGAHFLLGIRINRHIRNNIISSLLFGPLLFSEVGQLTAPWLPPAWINLILFIPLYDVVYYWNHRLFHLTHMHWIHHKKLNNAIQCLDFDIVEFASNPIGFFATTRLVALPPMATLSFYVFYFTLQLAVHTGSTMDWPILISPWDHHIHHTKHHYNYSSMLKVSDKIFGTYYRGGGSSGSNKASVEQKAGSSPDSNVTPPRTSQRARLSPVPRAFTTLGE